jgi:TRAP-type C4-dicarboxylate transport system permease small subunit
VSVDKAAQRPNPVYSFIEKGIRYAGTGFVYCSIFLFVILMLLDTADVVGRKFFDSPIIGTMELSQVIMGGVVLLGWSYTQRYRGHVFVDMFISKYPPRVRVIMDIIMLCLSLVLFAFITYASWVLAVQHIDEHRVFPTLRTTSTPYYFFVPIGGFFMCLEMILQIIEQVNVLRRRG